MAANLKGLIKDKIKAPGTPLGDLVAIVREPLRQLVNKMRPYPKAYLELPDQLCAAANAGGFNASVLTK